MMIEGFFYGDRRGGEEEYGDVGSMNEGVEGWKRKEYINYVNVRSNNLSVKWQRFKPSGCKDIGIAKFECLAKS